DTAAIEESIAQARNQLAALIGAGPDRGLALNPPSNAQLKAFGLPANLGADLIGRRPDVAAARWRAQAAGAGITQARAQFYPNVNLTAFIGVQSLGLEQLTQSGSDIGQIGPAISLPLFQGGKLRANLNRAEAARDEAVASYQDAIVRALHDVADVA